MTETTKSDDEHRVCEKAVNQNCQNIDCSERLCDTCLSINKKGEKGFLCCFVNDDGYDIENNADTENNDDNDNDDIENNADTENNDDNDDSF